jgi:hypothetical protein
MLSIDWKTAPDGYQVILYKGNQEITSHQSTNPPATLTTDSLMAGTYCVKVKVRCKANTVDDSTKCEPCIVKLEAPSNILLSHDSNTEKLKVTWQPVESATRYRVQIVQVFNPKEIATDKNDKISYEYETDVSVLAQQARAYQAWVQAIGDEQHIDSNIGKSDTIFLSSNPIRSPLPAPAVTQSYDVGAKTLTGKWNPVENATGYLAQVVNLDENNTVVVQQQLNNSNQTSHPFDTNQFTTSGAGNYQVWVKAIGNKQYLDSPFGKAKESIPRLAAPQNVSQKSEDEFRTRLTAEWDAVTNVTSYDAQLVKVKNNTTFVDGESIVLQIQVVERPQVSFETRDFSEEQEVNYQVWVKAVGDAKTLDSVFREATPPVTRLEAPKSVTMKMADDGKTVSANWVVVEKANGYLAQVVNVDEGDEFVKNLSAFINKDASPLTVSFEKNQFPSASANYQIWVKAETNDKHHLDSAFSKPTDKILIDNRPQGGDGNDVYPSS